MINGTFVEISLACLVDYQPLMVKTVLMKKTSVKVVRTEVVTVLVKVGPTITLGSAAGVISGKYCKHGYPMSGC